MQAGISQAEDEFPEYGQGASGFGKRYGATLADEVSSSFFTDEFYPDMNQWLFHRHQKSPAN
jgi:hypothetical protein